MIALQPLTFQRFLFMLLDSMANGFGYGYYGARIQNQKMSWRMWLVSFIYSFFTFGLLNFLFNVDTSIRLPIVSLLLILFCFVIGKKRGFDIFKSGFLLIVFLLLSDALIGVIYSLFPPEFFELLSYYDQYSNIIRCVFSVIANLLIASFTIIFKWGQKQFLNRQRREIFFRYFRPVLIVICMLLLLFRILKRSEGTAFMDRFFVSLPDFILIAAVLLIGVSYMVQDIRYIGQLRRNDSLLQQQKIQDLLLKDTRIFRHNIANLLYGFQGMLLSKDYSAIRTYYDNMVSTCTIINNENVLALRRIPSMPLRALLVNKIQAANDQHVPFYVYVDEELNYHGINDIKMCELIGILLDNAADAALESRAPFISVELHNAGHDMEFVIRNTYRERTDENNSEGSFFPSLSPSKEDHQGIGLIHAREMIGKTKNVLLNIYYQGRFVEASLLFS